jgi:tripartite-type tricarboxylate transporter receptor subunit TctC
MRRIAIVNSLRIPLFVLCAVAFYAVPVCGQTWPAKPIRLVVPLAPGGPSDLLARTMAQQLTPALGQPIVVDNRTGAGGTIGVDAAAKAPADGYTLLLIASSTFTITANLYSKLPYDARKDFTPVSILAAGPYMLTVHPSLPAKTFKDLLALDKARPKDLNYGSGGTGTGTQMSMELLKLKTGLQITHIPYKGAGPALQGLLAGDVDVMFDGLGSSAQHIKSGKIKALAVASEKRVPAFPNLPTATEAGVPGYVVSTWYGLWGPRDMPKDVADKMIAEVTKALNTPELKDIWLNNGSETPSLTGEAFGKFVSADIKRWAVVVKASGTKLD